MVKSVTVFTRPDSFGAVHMFKIAATKNSDVKIILQPKDEKHAGLELMFMTDEIARGLNLCDISRLEIEHA